MRIIKNNQEIEIQENITTLTLDEDDHIIISEYVRFFDPKLDYGALVLVDDTKEIRVDNITNVLNNSDAKVEFNDCLIDSMDELFELIKYSLGSEFHIDIQEMVNDDSGDFELAIFDALDDTKKHIQEEQKNLATNEIFEDNQNLLILISTSNADSILNFPIIYSNLMTKTKEHWSSITLLFFGSSIECVVENSKLNRKIKELISNNVSVKYNDEFNDFYERAELNDMGIVPNYDYEFITNAIKSENWSVVTV